VFDEAETMVVFELEDGRELARRDVRLGESSRLGRTTILKKNGVDILICGAISQPLAAMCEAAGVTVIPWVCGALDDVLEAFAADALPDPRLTMPGCRGRGRRGRGRGRGAGPRGRARTRRRGRGRNGDGTPGR
jgi:predicted Fe-Mo cluster-binding NifX family protein